MLSAIYIPELVDTIVDNLWDDKTSSASCALVAKIWLRRSHMHLFKPICPTARTPVRGRDLDAAYRFQFLSAFVRLRSRSLYKNAKNDSHVGRRGSHPTSKEAGSPHFE